MYVSVLYLNESRKQLVLACKGLDKKCFKNFLSKDFDETTQLQDAVKGILNNEVIPQLYYCYEATRECVEIAKDLNCFLSFTGYANGAWLAEHSIYYANSEFEHKINKAVLFESPGMCKSEEEMEKTGIISRERKFSVKDLNVINYLTGPCFANSCNQHAGKIYRLFIYEDELAKEKILGELEKTISGIPGIGFLFRKFKDYKFVLIGLSTMFNEEKLDLIINEFDAKTGKPIYCEQVTKWPVVELPMDNKFGETLNKNVQNLLEKTIGIGVEIVPFVPDIIKKPIGSFLGQITAFVIDKGAKKMTPGPLMLINLLLELIKIPIDRMEKFKDPKFYVKIGM